MPDLFSELRRQLKALEVAPLLDFVVQISGHEGFARPNHLAFIAAELERTVLEPVRGIWSVSPRHGKTELILHYFAWRLKRDPRTKCAFVTYGDQLAVKKSKRARDLAVRAGVRLAHGSESSHDWATKEGGGLVASSIQGGLTGLGFDVIVFDDPIKNHEEANSELMRDKVFELATSAALTRVEPGGSFIVNGARWHADDVIGRLDATGRWPKINLQALSRDGVVLWPERWTRPALEAIKLELTSREWEALYMGEPTNESGNIFAREWLNNRYKPDALPAVDLRCLVIDGAWEEGVTNDWSVIDCWSRSKLLGKYFLEDEWRGRVQLPDLLAAIRAQYAKHAAHAVVIEKAASGIGAGQTLLREGYPVIWAPATASKEARAEQVSPLFAAGRVWLPDGAPWLNDWIEEHVKFHTVKHDDRVDCTGHALAWLSDPHAKQRTTPQGFRGSIFQR